MQPIEFLLIIFYHNTLPFGLNSFNIFKLHTLYTFFLSQVLKLS